MADRKRVAVTGASRAWAPAWWCTALTLRLLGAEPVRISTRHTPRNTEFDALVIGGGNDIAPEHYGGEILMPVKLDPERDALEIHWIRHALDAGKPLLGICRGAQLINVVLGGNLHSDIRELRRVTSNRPGLLPTKTVALQGDSLLAQALGKQRLRVNSLHHQAIDRTGDGLRVVGRDLDNLVQAVEGQGEQRIAGVQWHPEYLFYLPVQRRLFAWLLGR